MTDHHTPAQTAALPRRSPAEDEISLWGLLAVIVRRRGTIIAMAFLVAAVAVALTMLQPLHYTTTAMFRPQGSQTSTSQLTALATQFGVAVPSAGEEASPAFYAEIVTSREILQRAATRLYDVEGVGSVHLRDLLEIEEETEALRDEKVVNWLREEAVTVSTGLETGVVTVSVVTNWPDLSQKIAQDLLAEIGRFNMNTRQSQAAAERVFIEGRVAEGEEELRAAEDSLRMFLEANRQFENSPLLQFRHDRLQRQVSQRQSVLTTLVQSYEEARISEVRDTPVITVLQSPYLPPGPDSRSLLLAGLLGIVLGSVLGVLLAFVVEAVRRPHAGDPAREDFRRSWDALVRSIPLVGRRHTA
jgi:uncharacterized protein involved in exopolysaccharide biosynthesis